MKSKKRPISAENPSRRQAISDFRRFVSAGKVRFYRRHFLVLVPGVRSGCVIEDMNGKRFLNFHSNGGVFNLGHNNARIIEAVRQGAQIWDMGDPRTVSEPKRLLADKLAEAMPGDISVSAFSTSGSEAMDLAIKVAMAHTGRPGVVSTVGGYHGGSGYAVAAGDPAFRQSFGPVPEGFKQAAFGSIEALEEAVGRDTAAVVMETIPATAGMRPPPDDYFSQVRRLCDERGVVFILDEVQTGLGRTGPLWAIDHWGVTPDIMVIGKGLSGGIYPIAATCFRPGPARVFQANPFLHPSDYNGPDLGCIAALEVLRMATSPQFREHVVSMAAFLAQALARLRAEHPGIITDIFQKGLFMGIEFASEAISTLMVKLLFDNGMYTVYCGNRKRVLQFLPPLIITEEHAMEGIGILRKSLEDMKKPKGRFLLFLLNRLSPKPV